MIYKMRLNVWFNEMAPFWSFAGLIKGCSSYGRNGGHPARGDGQPVGNEVFAVERHGLPEDFVSFPALCGVCNRRHLYLCRIGRLSGGSLQGYGRHRESLCASGLRSPELSAQVRRANSCTSCKPAHMDASITRTGRNG